MGYNLEESNKALKDANNDFEKALDSLNHKVSTSSMPTLSKEHSKVLPETQN